MFGEETVQLLGERHAAALAKLHFFHSVYISTKLHFPCEFRKRFSTYFSGLGDSSVPDFGTPPSKSAIFDSSVPFFGTLPSFSDAVQESGCFGIGDAAYAGNLGSIGTESETDLSGKLFFLISG